MPADKPKSKLPFKTSKKLLDISYFSSLLENGDVDLFNQIMNGFDFMAINFIKLEDFRLFKEAVKHNRPTAVDKVIEIAADKDLVEDMLKNNSYKAFHITANKKDTAILSTLLNHVKKVGLLSEMLKSEYYKNCRYAAINGNINVLTTLLNHAEKVDLLEEAITAIFNHKEVSKYSLTVIQFLFKEARKTKIKINDILKKKNYFYKQFLQAIELNDYKFVKFAIEELGDEAKAALLFKEDHEALLEAIREAHYKIAHYLYSNYPKLYQKAMAEFTFNAIAEERGFREIEKLMKSREPEEIAVEITEEIAEKANIDELKKQKEEISTILKELTLRQIFISKLEENETSIDKSLSNTLNKYFKAIELVEKNLTLSIAIEKRHFQMLQKLLSTDPKTDQKTMLEFTLKTIKKS